MYLLSKYLRFIKSKSSCLIIQRLFKVNQPSIHSSQFSLMHFWKLKITKKRNYSGKHFWISSLWIVTSQLKLWNFKFINFSFPRCDNTDNADNDEDGLDRKTLLFLRAISHHNVLNTQIHSQSMSLSEEISHHLIFLFSFLFLFLFFFFLCVSLCFCVCVLYFFADDKCLLFFWNRQTVCCWQPKEITAKEIFFFVFRNSEFETTDPMF